LPATEQALPMTTVSMTAATMTMTITMTTTKAR
jgi:hypothetical protein